MKLTLTRLPRPFWQPVSLFPTRKPAVRLTIRPAKKHASAKKPAAPPGPPCNQIRPYEQQMQGQIDSLRSDLATKDAQLKQAQQAAADAQAAADKAEADAQRSSRRLHRRTPTAVTTLQSTVGDLKTNQLSLATTVSDETTSIKKAISNPDAIHFKGVTLSPTGSFIAAETVWRKAPPAATSTPAFTGVPLAELRQASQMSEFFGSAGSRALP